MRLTERDLVALSHLAELRAARLDDVARLLGHLGPRKFPVGERTARDIVARWRALGLAAFHPNPRGGLGIVTIERAGLRALGPGARGGDTFVVSELPTGLPAWRDIPHDLSVAAVAAQLICDHGCQWVGETTARSALPAGAHRPDGVATTQDGQRVAIEVERHTKSGKRWRENITGLLTTWDLAAYYAAPTVVGALSQWLPNNLTPTDLARVRVIRLGEAGR